MEVTSPGMLSDLTKEICKKILHVSSAKDIIGQSQAQHMGCVLDRLPKYNTDFLTLTRKAPQSQYETTGTLSVPLRKLLVKTCIGDLVKRCERVPLFSTTFPSLSVRVAGQGEGFEHYYDPVSHCGFLEAKVLTDDCGEDKKLRREDRNTSSTDEWVTLIKRLRPSAAIYHFNIPAIMSGMEETYTSRRAWISKDSPTATEIFSEYPRFLDMPSLHGGSPVPRRL
ncbi:2,4-dienoyl-CoA reductase [(3E)-enoyl-CoA-producing], mitochondrial [Sarotherodon galilaeus]